LDRSLTANTDYEFGLYSHPYRGNHLRAMTRGPQDIGHVGAHTDVVPC